MFPRGSDFYPTNYIPTRVVLQSRFEPLNMYSNTIHSLFCIIYLKTKFRYKITVEFRLDQ